MEYEEKLMKKSTYLTEATCVLSEDGYRQIKNIQEGDLVYSKNVEIGEKVLKKITKVFVREVRKIINVYKRKRDKHHRYSSVLEQR